MTGLDWLQALRPSLDLDLDPNLWAGWQRLDAALDDVAVGDPGPGDPAARSRWLRRVRTQLSTHHGSGLWQAGAQFLAGYRDLDLREATGTGHGQMILDHAPGPLARSWADRLARGALVGIAATEAHGGSRIQEITTTAHPLPGGLWRVSGSKCWVSRLTESDAFVVFLRDPAGTISAVVIDATAPGLVREPRTPSGLGGWSWGMLTFDAVDVDPTTQLIGEAGQGLRIFREHFTRFRPLVTLCALGTAASVHDRVRGLLADRSARGVIPRIRDNALIALGSAWAQINAATLLALHATHPDSHDLAARLGKAHGVDTACRTTEALAPLVGAVGFQHDHPIAKARTDLAALQYADGIHDSLYRSGGAELLRAATGRPRLQAA
ncbi:acyl-CoA dehydrogenase [Myceligenerans crystallogenes]|uniref:Acyl-CoA dehydrogenase n=1 Tax=Myceligenerans crystallogenes TaxID=316335 RepID=A0ABN2N6M5_9MICO